MKFAKVGALTANDATTMLATAAMMRRVFIPHGIACRCLFELDQINLINNRNWYSLANELGLDQASFLNPGHTFRFD